MISFTALVLTYNEEENIGRTLGALSWAKEVVIVDSGSTDQTLERARAAHPNVRIVQREFDSHTNQWNFGLDQITTEWALTLDADYELSRELAAEIAAINPAMEQIGFWAQFEYRIYGHPLRGSSYPPRIVLFRVSQARYVDDGHTQTLWIKDLASGGLRAPSAYKDGKVAASPTVRIGKLAGKIYHDDRKPLSRWIQEQGRYATLEARHLLAKPITEMNSQDRLRRKIFFAAPAMFLYLLFIRGLILDGWPGWFYVGQRTIAELLLSLRLLTEREKLELSNGG
jgi:glycosyltransferase involved in cell wall biosynthesis